MIGHLGGYDPVTRAEKEGDLEVYNHIFALDQQMIWKNPEYYKGDAELYDKYGKGSFDVFLKDVLGISPKWYQSMKAILALSNGKEMLLKYGATKMVTYLNSTEDEWKQICATLEAGATS